MRAALDICKELNKPYLIEVTGVAWDANWYHSIRGKLTAYTTEQGVKKRLKDAPYALYALYLLLAGYVERRVQ